MANDQKKVIESLQNRLCSVHLDLPGRLDDIKLTSMRLLPDLTTQAALPLLLKYCMTPVPSKPGEWAKIVEKDVGLHNVYESVMQDRYVLKSKAAKNRLHDIAATLCLLHGVKSCNAELPYDVDEEMVSVEENPSPKQLFNQLNTAYLSVLRDSKTVLKELLTNVVMNSEFSPLWSLSLFDVLCILQLYANLTLTDVVKELPESMDDFDGTVDHEEQQEEHIRDICNDAVNTILEDFGLDDNDVIEDVSGILVPTTIDVMAYLCRLIPDGNHRSIITALERVQGMCNKFTDNVQDGGHPLTNQEVANVAGFDHSFYGMNYRTGVPPRPFPSVFSSSSFNSMNVAKHPLEEALRLIEVRSQHVHDNTEHEPVPPNLQYELPVRNQFAETRQRLTIQQHRVQSLSSYMRVFSRLKHYLVIEENNLGHMTGNAYNELRQQLEQTTNGEALPCVAVHAENVLESYPRAPGPPNDVRLRDENETLQLPAHKISQWDYETFGCLAMLLCPLVEFNMFQSMEYFEEFKGQIVSSFKWICTYREQYPQGVSNSEEHRLSPFARFLAFMAEYNGMHSEPLPQQLPVLQSFIMPDLC